MSRIGHYLPARSPDVSPKWAQAMLDPPPAAARRPIIEDTMRSLVAILVTAVAALGIYYYFLKQAAPAPGTAVTQEVSLTGVQMDLLSIAQAERAYNAQNGGYASLDQLTSTGALTMERSGRDGYTYSIATSAGGFTATATYTAPPPPPPAMGQPAAAPLHYPSMWIDQTMEVHQGD
jgi:hypothetical protein